MSHANITEPTGEVVGPLLHSCRVPDVQEGGPKDLVEMMVLWTTRYQWKSYRANTVSDVNGFIGPRVLLGNRQGGCEEGA